MPTTRNVATRAVVIKLLLAAAFAAIGAWVVLLAIDMVGIFGESMGVDERSRQIYSRAHIAVHVFGTASSVAVGLFVLSRNKLLAALAMLAIICCGGYGIVNMIGFATTNRLSVSEAKTVANQADERQYQTARKNKQDAIKWHRATIVTEEIPREKRRLEAALAKLEKELDAITPPKPTAATVLADPQATWFARLAGSTSEKWQLALPVPVAVLLFAAEVLSFVFAVHLAVSALEIWLAMGDSSRRNEDDSSRSGGSNSFGGGTKKSNASTPLKPRLVPSVSAGSALSAAMGQPYHYSQSDAYADLQGLLAHGRTIPSQRFLAKRWHRPPPTITRWIEDWEEGGGITRFRLGKCKAIGGFAHAGFAAGTA